MNLPWKAKNAPLAAFATLALVGGGSIYAQADQAADKLYQSQIESCGRGNQVRMESNQRLKSHIIDRDALVDFMGAARDARVAAYDKDHQKSDKTAADSYSRLIERVESQVKFNPVPIVDCKKVIPKP